MQSGRERLAAYRERSRLNQKQLAGLLGLTDSYLSQLLSGRRNPGRETAIRIEQQTGVPVESWSDTTLSVPVRPYQRRANKPRIAKGLTGYVSG